MVAVWLLTLMAGILALPLSVSGSPVPVLRNQLWAAAWSPKITMPIVWAPSRVTAASAPRLRVLKSAVLSVPCAMLPPSQLAGLAQLPPLGLVQVPFWARAVFTWSAQARSED